MSKTYNGPILRRPNLGQPCLVRTSDDAHSVTFDVHFRAPSDDLDLKSLLNGTLFLQKLNDTRQVLQTRFTEKALENFPYQEPVPADLATYLEGTWSMDAWPADIRNGLIPLKVVEIGPSLLLFPPPPLPPPDPFFGGFQEGLCLNPEVSYYMPCPYDYLVRLQIEPRYLSGLQMPQLFNFVQKLPSVSTFHVNFHAVYLHSKDWHNFSFIHAPDTHIAWRNDFIDDAVRQVMGSDAAKDYVNYNDKFRKFIGFANQLHRRGKLDFILMTGDLVDYVNIGRKFGEESGHPLVANMPTDNFCFFRDLLTGWQVRSNEVVGEELEVPLFTTTGNHDFRPNEYPIIGQIELREQHSDLWWLALFGFPPPVDPITLLAGMGVVSALGIDLFPLDYYKDFGLTDREGMAYETGNPDDLPHYSDADGKDYVHHLCEAPSTYCALINPDLDYAIPLGPHRIICLDSGPDIGEFASTLDILAYYLQSEPVGEHFDFVHSSVDSRGFTAEQIQFLEDQVKEADGLAIIAFHNPLVGFVSIPSPLLRETVHKALTKEQLEQLTAYMKEKCSSKDLQPVGWSTENTRFFKRGSRDFDMGRGVADAGFAEFMQAVTQKTKNRKKAELILYGHTHRTLEYIVLPDNDVFEFRHDYYIDGKIDEPPSGNWAPPLPDYPDPLRTSVDRKKWWPEHSPLQIQTLSCCSPTRGPGPLGVLRFVVRNGVIIRIQRHYLKNNAYSSVVEPHAAYPILFVSPP
jgi:3',5'-cyclic AMP phosphodiesterase CpdA